MGDASMFRKLYWGVFVIWLSLRWIQQVNLGDRVRYKGEVYTVADGVIPGKWRLLELDNGDEGWVPRRECKKVQGPASAWRSFSSGYRFYMGYWYDSWVRAGVQPWMRQCNIWPNREKSGGIDR